MLTTDASTEALGAILSQGPIGRELPIAYASRTLVNAEKNYSTTEKELLAIVWGCRQFTHYLYGRKFTILTNHKPLTWVFNVKDPSSRLLRWRFNLEEYDYDVIYKPGTKNTIADALSGINMTKVKPITEISSALRGRKRGKFCRNFINCLQEGRYNYNSYVQELQFRVVLL